MQKGKLICLEGGDYAGKSTFLGQLKECHPEFKYTREPGNKLDTIHSSMCEEIRNELLNNKNSKEKEAQLFAASRYLHTIDIVELINKGYTVVTDRFLLSSYAYQAYANKLGDKAVEKYNSSAISLLEENNIKMHTLVFKLDKETYEKRKKLRMTYEALDEIEKRDEDFFKRVNNFFNEDVSTKTELLDVNNVL